ncbi:hypothetical protein HW115_14475 [Verrucomicrobiaceae bacterium N1E253]|uniref:Toluene tolerance protein n=1 Tax=Oceaniferula marina TaxID=2748318 RepID=A0A851GNX1_9BACT|nr:hypothetical protein [Oceaniferula marina]NWK56825.1 hypothetical protein [Oceaniferula marina]
MQPVTYSQEDFDALCRNGQAIDEKGGYPAVVLHPDDTVTKIWARKKKWLSSATLRPYSGRFIHNAEELDQREIQAPSVLKHIALAGSHVRAVTYQSLPGQSIRELLKQSPEQVHIRDLCHFIHHLHQKGILFRGMHLGNIIQLPDQQGYGLIDFTDVKFYAKPVPMLRRAANLATPLRYRKDVQRIKKAGLPSLLSSYLKILQLDETEQQRFKSEVNRYLK